MKYILLLSLISIIIAFLGVITYRKTKSIAVIFGFLLIYYWTFNGAWLFVIDVLSGYPGKDIGFTYYVIERKMFPLMLNSSYFISIIYYGIFFISLQLTVYLIVRKINFTLNNNVNRILNIKFGFLILISFASIFLSYACVHLKFVEAIEKNVSLYYILRHTPNRFNTLHQIFNMISVYAIYLCLLLYLSGQKVRYFSLDKKNVFIGILIFVNILIVTIYFILIGNKHDLIFAGLFGLLFYLANNFKVHWKKITLFALIIIFPLTLTDFVRGLPLLNFAFKMSPEEIDIYANRNVPSYMNVLVNNEMFYAHFSMYGVIMKDVDFTYGKSALCLIESFVPRVINQSRMEDAYTYYANAVNAKKGQGYSIHHATGWFINFGIIGVLLAGLCWGLVWGFIIKMNARIAKTKNKFLTIIYAMAPVLFVAFIPNLIRNGIEGYKGLVFEAIIIPAVIVYLAQIEIRKLGIFKKHSK